MSYFLVFSWYDMIWYLISIDDINRRYICHVLCHIIYIYIQFNRFKPKLQSCIWSMLTCTIYRELLIPVTGFDLCFYLYSQYIDMPAFVNKHWCLSHMLNNVVTGFKTKYICIYIYDNAFRIYPTGFDKLHHRKWIYVWDFLLFSD